jgi:2-dehydropantoate 2-reductase
MRIAVIGSGSVGAFYGARLARVGHDVRFVMRRDLEAVRRNGLTIKSCEGDFHIQAAAFATPEEIGPVDLVMCALKATAMDVAERLVRPCVGPNTLVLALMNGLGIEEQFGAWFGPERVLGGLAFVCINRGEPGVIHHMDYGRVVIGHLGGERTQAERVAQLFADAGFDSRVPSSLRQGRWEKLMWNIPFSTLAITAGGVTTREILADEGLSLLARRLIVETGTAGNADGCSLDIPAMLEKMMANTATMGAYRPSMLVDYQNKLPLEVEAILGEPVRRANALGVPAPMMEMQYRLTAFLDKLNRGELESSGQK